MYSYQTMYKCSFVQMYIYFRARGVHVLCENASSNEIVKGRHFDIKCVFLNFTICVLKKCKNSPIVFTKIVPALTQCGWKCAYMDEMCVIISHPLGSIRCPPQCHGHSPGVVSSVTTAQAHVSEKCCTFYGKLFGFQLKVS